MTTKGAPEAAEIALAMSECMNLLFLFAAPRVLASVRGSGMGGLDAQGALASLRRFLRHASGIRARADAGRVGEPGRGSPNPSGGRVGEPGRGSPNPSGGPSGDVERLVQAAMIVEEIAGTLGTIRFEEPLPGTVVDRARRALSILGVSEPKGGWDPFEGFTVPYPPPSPRR